MKSILPKRPISYLYIVVAAVVAGCLVIELTEENFQHVVLCAVTLLVFALPWIVEKILHVTVGTGLILGLWWLMFGAEILGEMNNFYGRVPGWDTMLHTLSGFLAAGLGLSLFGLWSGEKVQKIRPVIGVVFAVAFSMAVSVVWEFCEFTGDQLFFTDGQKDRIVTVVSSVELNPENVNKPLVVKDVERTVLYGGQGEELYVIEGGYLDVGIIDTMKDMFVNMVGALVFAWGAWRYLEDQRKGRFVRWFLIER